MYRVETCYIIHYMNARKFTILKHTNTAGKAITLLDTIPNAFQYGTSGRTRTGTPLRPQILSLMRLPLRHTRKILFNF